MSRNLSQKSRRQDGRRSVRAGHLDTPSVLAIENSGLPTLRGHARLRWKTDVCNADVCKAKPQGLRARHLRGNQNFTRVRAESHRRPPRHRRDACSTAWPPLFDGTAPWSQRSASKIVHLMQQSRFPHRSGPPRSVIFCATASIRSWCAATIRLVSSLIEASSASFLPMMSFRARPLGRGLLGQSRQTHRHSPAKSIVELRIPALPAARPRHLISSPVANA